MQFYIIIQQFLLNLSACIYTKLKNNENTIDDNFPVNIGHFDKMHDFDRCQMLPMLST